MNNHPFITQQIASARQDDVLAAAARRRFVRAARSTGPRRGRDVSRRALSARPPQAHCACR